MVSQPCGIFGKTAEPERPSNLKDLRDLKETGFDGFALSACFRAAPELKTPDLPGFIGVGLPRGSDTNESVHGLGHFVNCYRRFQARLELS
jgi:hypothetical protein